MNTPWAACRASLSPARKRAQHRIARFFALLSLIMLVSGCATDPPWKLSPEFASAEPAIHRVLLLPSLVDLYEEQANYHLVTMPAGSGAGSASLDGALVAGAGTIGVELIPVDEKDPAVAELPDLVVVVDVSIQRHAFRGSEQCVPARGKHFDYRLGDISGLLVRYDADAASRFPRVGSGARAAMI
jgi:hypothetical protein